MDVEGTRGKSAKCGIEKGPSWQRKNKSCSCTTPPHYYHPTADSYLWFGDEGASRDGETAVDGAQILSHDGQSAPLSALRAGGQPLDGGDRGAHNQNLFATRKHTAGGGHTPLRLLSET